MLDLQARTVRGSGSHSSPVIRNRKIYECWLLRLEGCLCHPAFLLVACGLLANARSSPKLSSERLQAFFSLHVRAVVSHSISCVMVARSVNVIFCDSEIAQGAASKMLEAGAMLDTPQKRIQLSTTKSIARLSHYSCSRACGVGV